MTSLASKVFTGIAASAMTLTPLATADAQDALSSANQNVAPASVSTEPLTVQYVEASDRTLNDARTIAADASHERLAIVVWGGNRALQQEAYNAALDLVDMGIEVAFVRAPDHDESASEAFMQVYARATPRAEGHWSETRLAEVRPDVRNAALRAYEDAFPQRLAALQPASLR